MARNRRAIPAAERKFSFRDKVALVTGSAQGIGKTIAASFGDAGARVAICDIDRERSNATVLELRKAGIDARYHAVDLSKRGEPGRMVAEVTEKFGRLDILVNNARAGTRSGLLEETEENWDLTMSVGLRAAFFASKEAIPVMRSEGGGSIVNICSISAFLVSQESASYHAAKAGMMQLTRYLAMYAGDRQIRVNAVLPGFIVQDEDRKRYLRNDNNRYRARAEGCHPLRKVGSAGDVADATLFFCSDSANFITGQTIIVDGGLSIQDSWTAVSAAATTREKK
jgi:NAD(P)-dependent dehydrogenase (short-subunit alcohol dehydrogenase family)